MDLNKLTTTELKALAFDQMVEIEKYQKNLQLVNQVLAQKVQEESKTLV
jgi:hypothetical protein